MSRFEHHDRWADEIAAYAIGSLAESERERLEDHLAECASCAERLRWLAPAVELLPESVAQIEPPQRLRERLLSVVYAEAGEAAPGVELASATIPTLQHEVGEGAAPPPPPAPAAARWRLGLPGLATRFTVPLALGFATVVAAAVGVGWLLGGAGEGSGTDPLRTIEAVPARSVAAASGSLVVRRDGATLSVTELPDLRRGEVYQAWVRRDSEVEPSAVFVTRAGGSGEAAISADLSGADEVLVTREPRGGSVEPTGSPLLSAGL